MLISRVSDDTESREHEHEHEHEYQTASELFDMMAKNHPFDPDVGQTLSARDLVILYKNIDLGTKLMSDAGESRRRRPNQHVENVVYNDEADSEGSDVSEIYGTDDIQNVYSINNERLDLFNGRPSLENTLCQKLGNLEIQASNLSMDYDQHFLFKDLYIKEELKNLNRNGGEFDGTALPASLLDYICCKRLEDNYNFYLDNIIRYVKHTIEQLKRISNGDYLTDRAKEKWREVENACKGEDENTKVLATSTSIPLQLERKLNGLSTAWDDIIHSEVDVRSLSKILEKKIIVEVPKLICGSYKLFSKFCSDNLIISCKREEETVTEKKEPRVDVVLQLERSELGQVMSNINSMIILQAPPIQIDKAPKPLPVQFFENEEQISNIEKEKEFLNTKNEDDEVRVKKVKIVEIPETKYDSDECEVEEDKNADEIEDDMPKNTTADDENCYDDVKSNSFMESCDSSVALRDILDTRAIPDIMRKEAPYNFISPDDLSLSIHKLNMSSLPEESSDDIAQNPVVKKKSNTKVRIKSPYENKSYIMEEKKRKKLLEIREKREKKKMAIGENCKITKYRYGKGAIMPQPSSSVTKLSITNKSFYNSIYGQNMNVDSKSIKGRVHKGKRDLCLNASEQFEGECDSAILTPEKNNQKYINRSYYLDEAVTEMMYTQLRQSDCSSVREIFSVSPSAASAEFSGNVVKAQRNESGLFDKQANSERYDLDSLDEKKDSFDDDGTFNLQCDNRGTTESRTQMISSSRSVLNVVPANSPKDKYNEEHCNEVETPTEIVPTVECRKSIDKLYDLMKRLEKIDPLDTRPSSSKLFSNINKLDAKLGQGSSTIQGSDSGTSLKHHLTSSNPSSLSFEKINNIEEIPVLKTMSNKKTDAPTTVVPKVIISTKQQTVKIEVEKIRKDRKRVALNHLSKVPDNPLKAISQLLHEFDSVQKTRQKPLSDSKTGRKQDYFEAPSVSRQGSTNKRRSRIDQQLKEHEIVIDKSFKTPMLPRERRPRPNPMEFLKIPHQQIPIEEKHLDRTKENRHTDRAGKEDKHMDRFTKRKIADIIDEVKEAKGEAVRGPSKLNSRLNSLAQPKKSYVQAHSEEYQTKYGRNLMADRLQRLASAPPAPAPALAPERPVNMAARNKQKRINPEVLSAVSVRPPPPPLPLERGRARRSASSSPDAVAPRQRRASVVPEALKTKMVVVESYVKSHYGRISPPVGATARAPLVPHDLDLVSEPSSPTAEESTAIGSKLHRIIDNMLAAPAPLAALAENPQPLSREASSADSDYRADIFEDKHVRTAVETVPDPPAAGDTLPLPSDPLPDASLTVGTFRPQMRIKNVSLTPQRSMNRVLVLQSGDAASVVLDPVVSRSLKLSASRSDVTADLATLPDPHLGWSFPTNIPVQIATVGYAFPEYKSAYGETNSAMRSLEDIFKLGISVSSTSTRANKKSDKTNQCFKGSSQSKNDDDDASLNNRAVIPVSKKKHSNLTSIATEVPVFGSVQRNYGDCTNLSMEKFKADTVEPKVKTDIEDVDCTSSLDMLVGLLNEIQKITTCHITDTVQCAGERCAVLDRRDAALEDTVKNIHSHELVSIASLDKLRQLESSPSIYSLYLSDGDKEMMEENISIPRLIPNHVDKEVGVDFPVREYTNMFTDVPSTFFPITIAHSTNVSNSLIGILSKPSSRTMISLEELQTACSDSAVNYNTKIIEIEEGDSAAKYNTKIIEVGKGPTISAICEIPVIEYTEIEQLTSGTTVAVEHKVVNADVHKVKSVINILANRSKCCRSADFDPLMKIKRDILVTVYSVLVLTVFAALSFPEILYHV